MLIQQHSNAVQGPMALQNMTSPTGAILGTGSNIIFSIGFDQEVRDICTNIIMFCYRLVDQHETHTFGFMRTAGCKS